MNSNPKKYKISKNLQRKLIELAISGSPCEVCGIIFGENYHITGFIPVTNISKVKSEFRFDPDEHIKSLYKIEKSDFQYLGIYHSHPLGPSHPSTTDLNNNRSKKQIYLIISKEFSVWGIKLFNISDQSFSETEFEVELSE